MDSAGTRWEWISGTAAVATGLATLTFALFPFAIPIVALAGVVIVPLAAPVVALAILGAILGGIWLTLRSVARLALRLGRGPRRDAAAPQRAGSRVPAESRP
jgi:hypothetical protein